MSISTEETETVNAPLLMNFASRKRAVGALRVLGLMGEERDGLIASAMGSEQWLEIEEGLLSDEVHEEVHELARLLLDVPANDEAFRFMLSYDG